MFRQNILKNIKTLRNKEKTSPLAEELYIASTYVFNKKKSSTAKEGKKIFQNITVNCDCIGTLNGQRFEKTKETLNELGVEIR